jgi:hypothetical protein
MNIRLWITLAASCAVLALAGCTTYPEGPYVAVAKPNKAPGPGKPIVLLNSDLINMLAVDHPPTVQRNAAGLLQIQVGLRNRTDDKRLMLQAQTLFFDNTGQVLYSQPGSEAAWQTLTLAPNQTDFYSQQALTTEAASYIVQVRHLWPKR